MSGMRRRLGVERLMNVMTEDEWNEEKAGCGEADECDDRR